VRKSLILILILLVPSLAYLVLTTGKHNIKKLQYFGPKSLAANGKDTIYHTIPAFSLIDQDGKPFGEGQGGVRRLLKPGVRCEDIIKS